MPHIIKGANGWEFVVVTDAGLNDDFKYVIHRGEKTALHILFNKCSKEIIGRICEHEKSHLLQAINLMDEGGEINKLERLTSLRAINFGYASHEFDFSALVNLEAIGGVWSRKWRGLDKCMYLTKYRVSKYKDVISNIPQLAKQEEISLIQPTISSLDGMEVAAKLSSLEITMANKLQDISAISGCAKTISKLVIDCCKKITSYDGINSLQNLIHLAITDGADINSISFIEHMNKLEFLSVAGTRILDNDLSYCIRNKSLRKFGCDNEKSYLPSREIIKAEMMKRIM